MREVRLSRGLIHYAEHGQGPTVVLLHGLLMDHTVWDAVLPGLPDGFRYIRPVLPLGAHSVPMNDDADLSMRGMVQLLAEFMAALDLRDVALVHTDWGGGLFLTAYGLDERVARLIILSCEAFDNFPPGLPGRVAVLAARVPGGMCLARRQLRIGWFRRLPVAMGLMSRNGIPAAQIRAWTAPGLANSKIRRDVRKYATAALDRSELVRNTEALQHFTGDALVLWSTASAVMPREHGRRLARILPKAQLAEIDAYVLSMIDQPEQVALSIADFLQSTPMGGSNGP